MASVLVKAQRISDSQWVEGYYVHQYGSHQIYLPEGSDTECGFDNYHVNAETICLYTGKRDIHKEKIWTNDIVKAPGFTKCGIVTYSADDAAFIVRTEDMNYFMLYFDELERIGNVFDNPELIEEAARWQN